MVCERILLSRNSHNQIHAKEGTSRMLMRCWKGENKKIGPLLTVAVDVTTNLKRLIL
jgi:hypothetical protein